MRWRHGHRLQARADRQSPHLSSAGSSWAVGRDLLLLRGGRIARGGLSLLSTRAARRDKSPAGRSWPLLAAAAWLAAACPQPCCRLASCLLPLHGRGIVILFADGLLGFSLPACRFAIANRECWLVDSSRGIQSRPTQVIRHNVSITGQSQSQALNSLVLNSMVFKAGSAQEEFLVDDVDECASGFTLTNDGEALLAVEARNVEDAHEDMLLLMNALRWDSVIGEWADVYEQRPKLVPHCWPPCIHCPACCSGACTLQDDRAPS
jgi:hypothetical protein